MLEIRWNALISIVDEMSIALMRAAYSEIVREGLDFSCALFDIQGNMLAQSDRMGTPAHLGTMPISIKSLLKEYKTSEIFVGDVFCLNDPYSGAGHLPDLVVITPVFHKNRLVAFASNIANLPDIGGSGPGGFSPNSREIYEEGLFIPLSRLYRRGLKNDELFKIIRSNVRVPNLVIGDILAQVSANRLAKNKLLDFIVRNKLTDFRKLSKEVIERSEIFTKESIKNIPKGTYESQIELTDFNSVIKCKVKVEEERIFVDYGGTSSQVDQAVNSVFNYTYAYAFHALKCITSPSIPNNQGCMDPIVVTAPEGSILNPRPPAALAARHLLAPHISWSILSSLSKAIPNRLIGCSGVGGNYVSFYGINPRSGERFISLLNGQGGTGGRPFGDGANVMIFPQMAQNHPVEVMETTTPVRVVRREIRPDSGGAGKWRGGNGSVDEFLILTDSQSSLFLKCDWRKIRPEGMAGGKAGSHSSAKIVRDGREKDLNPEVIESILPNDRLILEQSGGGGFGDPKKREFHMVSYDLLEGYITIENAKAQYNFPSVEK